MKTLQQRIAEIEDLAKAKTDKFHSDWEWDIINARKDTVEKALSIIQELQEENKKLKQTIKTAELLFQASLKANSLKTKQQLEVK